MVRTPLVSALFGLSIGGLIALCTSVVEVLQRGASLPALLHASPAMWVVWSLPFTLGIATYQIASHSAARERPVPWARPLPPPPISVSTVVAGPPPVPEELRVASVVASPPPAPTMDRPKTIQDDGMGGVVGDERLQAMSDTMRVLKEQSERAASAARARSAWLAALGPELRARLSWVIGQSDLLLQDGAKGNPPGAEQLQRIGHSAREIAALVSNVVDLSKIEIGQLSLGVEDVDLAQLVDEVRAIVGPLAAQHRNAFSARVDASARMVRADPLRLRQILVELLENAFRYTLEGQVQLVIERATPKRDAWVAIQVKDTGAGMTPEEVERAFEPYVEGAARIATGSRKGGVGLAIARMLAELMGGRIDVQSDKGIGTSFTVMLPPAPADGALPRRTDIPLQERVAGMKLLVVDGEPGGVLLARFLVEQRLDVQHYVDVAGARVTEVTPEQVVLVDCSLPDAWPWMEDLVLSGVRIVATSVRDEDLSRARQLGVRAVLLRPLDAQLVLATLDRCVDGPEILAAV